MTKKETFLTLEQTRKIAETHPTPFHIYDEHGIRENAARIMKASSWNKGFREYFTAKATPNPFLLKTLQGYDYDVDYPPETELMMSDAYGFSDGQIIFSSNDAPAGEFALTVKFGGIISLDDIIHISNVEEELGQLPEIMSCHYNPGDIFELSNGIMDNPGSSKHGMTPAQITKAFRILKAKGVKRFGLHALLASNTTANEYYSKLAGVSFRKAVHLKEEIGAEIVFIDLSGGVGVPYRPEQQANDIPTIGREVRKVYEEILTPAGLSNVTTYAETERFMLAPYGTLATKVIHEKHVYEGYIGVDVCVVNLMHPAIYGTYHRITALGKEGAPLDYVYDVTDSLCENNDKFATGKELPEVEMGDYLYIHDTGACDFSMDHNYNGELRSAELLLRKDGSVQLIHRTETPKGYFATLDSCNTMDKYLK